MKAVLMILLTGYYVLNTISGKAQYYFYDDRYYANDVVIEIGGSAGIMNCLTDLGGQKGVGKGFVKDLNWRVTRPCLGLYALGTFKEAIGLRLEASMGSIASSDHLLKNTDPDLSQRYGRNLSFRSRIAELQLAAEVHPLYLIPAQQPSSVSPYIMLGIAYFSFNPQAKLYGHWYDLHPLKLEGQGFAEYPGRRPYRLQQLNMPMGAGIRFEISPTINVRSEIVYRLLFTDYLDDVSTTYIDASLFQRYLSPDYAAIAKQLHSRMQELQPGYQVNPTMQRGDPNDDDTYLTMQLKIGWVMRKRIRR
jgi:hypothetical protein